MLVSRWVPPTLRTGSLGNDGKSMKIIFVDDDSVQLYQLARMLRGSKKLEMAGAYTDPQLAYDALLTIKPNLMITDINMPNMSGIELIKKSKDRLPDLEIIALTIRDDMPTVLEALKAGAMGYLLKGISKTDMLKAITELDNGGVPITPKVARGLIASLQADDPGSGSFLSGKEKDVLQLVGQGLLYKEIADKMSVTTHAIHWHVKGIFKKLHTNCRGETVIKARKAGLL